MEFDPQNLKKLYTPDKETHKGQNGKMLLIGGSHLFHGASLWALKVSSRIVDMVFYASTVENKAIVAKLKEEFRDGILVPEGELESYLQEADCVLIGPGMVRSAEPRISNFKFQISNLDDVNKIEDEGEQTYFLTKYLLNKYPDKRWVIDGGALQMMDLSWLYDVSNVILTPHSREFDGLVSRIADPKLREELLKVSKEEQVSRFAKEYGCIVLLKGDIDIVSDGERIIEIPGGNAGMTKGGTGDVLAGLVAALCTKNDALLSAISGSFINKKAGESLFEKVGYYFNASDLVDEIPKVMKKFVI